jgi:hypothetical protein
MFFSAPVDPAQFTAGVAFQKIAPVSPGGGLMYVSGRWVVSGNEVVVRFDSHLELSATYRIVWPGVRGADGKFGPPFDFQFTVEGAKTIVSEDITRDTVLTPAGSPYVVDPTKIVYVRDSVLRLEPGTDVSGYLVLLGTSRIEAIGTSDKPIRLFDGGLTRGETAVMSRFSHVQFLSFTPELVSPSGIDHCDIRCGGGPTPLKYPAVQSQPTVGADGYITDSSLHGCRWLRGMNIVFERNVVSATHFAMLGPSGATFSRVVNNHFTAVPQGYSDTEGFLTIPCGATGVIKGNTFLGLSPNTIGLQSVWSGCGVVSGAWNWDFSGNYWGTTDLATIGTWFWDSHDDSQLPWEFTVVPVLTSPDPATPMPKE